MKGLFLLLVTLSGVPIVSVILSRFYLYDPLETRSVRLKYDSESSLFYYYNEPSPSPLPWNQGGPLDNIEALPVPKKSQKKEIEKLHWTSVHGSSASTAYHFVSAYLDDRKDAKFRPAVAVVGYFSRTAKPTDLYCMIKFSNGRSGCLREKAIQMKSNCDSVVDKRKSKPMLYICRLRRLGAALPVSVRISNVSNCDSLSSSAEIPVGNLEHKKKNVQKKKFGVFLGGPLVLKEHLIANLTRFIQMSQLLGADLFTMYVHPELSGQEAIDFLQNSYPDTVRLVEWKNFQLHRPLHYYGQLVLITDCLYRSMYEVEYLVMMDLDEMILPVNHKSWAELAAALEEKGRYAAYSFLNRFFAPPSHFDPVDYNSTLGLEIESTSYFDAALESKVSSYYKDSEVPAYFSRTQEVECYFNHGAKTKLFFNPRRLVRATVHEACESVRTYKPVLRVSADVAISAHYRDTTIQGCVSKPTLENTIAIKFAKQFAERYSKVT